ncbi:hypothetical protein OS12_42520 [Dickeya oryzae]
MYYEINLNYNKKIKDKILYHILNIYFEDLNDKLFKQYLTYLESNDGYKEYFSKKIDSESINRNLYKKKVLLLYFVFFMVDKKTQIFKSKWPFSDNDLNEIMLIMGK